MTAAVQIPSSVEPVEKPEVPAYLVKEVLDGVPIYYKGYKEVLNGSKTPEEIMGSSSLQSIIVSYLMRVLFIQLDDKKYYILSSEIGSHISHKNNLSYDIGIFDKTVLTNTKINKYYTNVPAKIVIEVDVNIEMQKPEEWDYLTKKTETVFDFGTEKVFWVLSNSKKVIVAQPGQDWLIVDWNKDIELFDGHFFNIGAYLQSEGITLESIDI
jgi:hypothetical protein